MGATFLKRWLFLLSACLAAAGCAGGPVDDFVEGIVGHDRKKDDPSTGARGIADGKQLDRIDFLNLLDPEKRRFDVCDDLGGFSDMKETETVAETTAGVAQTKYTHRARQLSRKERQQNEQNAHDKQVQCAFAAFYTYTLSCPEEINAQDQISQAVCRHQQKYTFSGETAKAAAKNLALIIRRNQVQDKIVAVSENVCRRFKIALNDQITKTNFSLGSTATALAGLGAIFTPADTARALSGASAIFSGIRAQYNDAYLQSLTVQVVTKGIELKREQILDEINGKRYGPPFVDSAQEYESLGDKTLTVDLACYDEDSGEPEECTLTDIYERIRVAKASKKLLEIGEAQGKLVRYASRPYIPLSPFDKADIKLQEEFKKELTERLKKKREIEARLQSKQKEIKKIVDEAGDTLAAARAERDDDIEKLTESEAKLLRWEREIEQHINLIHAARDAKKGRGLLKNVFLPAETEQIRKVIDDSKRMITWLDSQRDNELPNNKKLRSKLNIALRTESVALAAALEELESDPKKEDPKKEDPKKEDPKKPEAGEGEGSEEGSEGDESQDKKSVPNDIEQPGAGKNPVEAEALAKSRALAEAIEALSPVESGLSPEDGRELSIKENDVKEIRKELKEATARIQDLEEKLGDDFAKIDAIVGVVPISQYTVEMAVADAIRYHAACTIPSGLEKALESVDNEKTPGFDSLRKGLEDMINIQRRMKQLQGFQKGIEEEEPEESSDKKRSNDEAPSE